MAITKYQIKKIKKILEEERAKKKPRYEFSALQRPNEPYVIDEILNGEVMRSFSSKSEEGKKLIKEGRVKYPKVPILILDL